MHFMMNFITILSIKNALTEDKDSCYQKLLTSRTNVPDEAFVVSSNEMDYEGKYARDSSLIEKAWCPKNKIHNTTKEFISIDLGSIYILKMIMTKGLSRHGYKSASYYYIKYKIEEQQEWIRYRNVSEFKKISGNKDHLTEKFNLFTPSIVTRWIRIYPISSHPEMICLNLQLYGCRYTNNVIEYQMVDGSLFYDAEKNTKQPFFTDQSYDGVLLHTGMLKSGLGKLTDNDYEKNDNNPFNISTCPFVGWSNTDFKLQYIHILFRFINNRKFFNVSLRAANYRTASVALPKRLVIAFSSDGLNFDKEKPINHAIEEDNKNFDTRWIVIDLKKRTGHFVSINIHFESQWIMIREILFSSEPLKSESYLESTQPTAFILKNNSTLSKIIVKSNAITITEIFLSSSISLGILFILAICLICVIKWKRKSRIRKYKKAMHLQSQDEEYNRILTLHHQNMKNQTLYYPVANIATLNTKFHTEEKSNKFRQMIIPEAYNYWFYNDFCLDSRSNVDTQSMYNDATKYISMEKNMQLDLSNLDIRGLLGNSQLYRMNLINFISTTSSGFSTFHKFVKQLNFKDLKTMENISINSYGRIDVVCLSINYSPYEMEPCDSIDDPNFEGQFNNTVVCVRKLKQDSPVSIKQTFYQELDNLNQINHKNLIAFVVVQDKCDLASYVVNEYTSLMDIFTLLQSLSILQSNNDLISIEQSQFLYIAVQLSDALSYLEYLGLVHRDVACRNILVINPHLYIKLSDLAIAQTRFRSQYWEVDNHHSFESNNKQNEITKSPNLIPIRWMSREVVSKKEFSTKSDVYAFGVCMWELFNYCQQLPYETLSDYQIFINKSLLNSNIQPHQSLKFPHSTARETIDIIEQCLVDDAQQRPTFKEIHIFFSKKNSGYKSNDALVKQLLVKYSCTTSENVPTIYFD